MEVIQMFDLALKCLLGFATACCCGSCAFCRLFAAVFDAVIRMVANEYAHFYVCGK